MRVHEAIIRLGGIVGVKTIKTTPMGVPAAGAYCCGQTTIECVIHTKTRAAGADEADS